MTTIPMPRLLRAREYAEAMHISLRTVKRQLQHGTCEVAPAFVAPYRWRAAEVARHIETSSLLFDRRRKDAQKQLQRGA
jgi:hypothetical protein